MIIVVCCCGKSDGYIMLSLNELCFNSHALLLRLVYVRFELSEFMKCRFIQCTKRNEYIWCSWIFLKSPDFYLAYTIFDLDLYIFNLNYH